MAPVVRAPGLVLPGIGDIALGDAAVRTMLFGLLGIGGRVCNGLPLAKPGLG